MGYSETSFFCFATRMPRLRRSSPALTIDLFPFLSILACTIGTLILLIIVMTLQAIDSQAGMTIVAKQDTGNNQQKSPRYLECSKDGVILYPDKTLVPLAQINQNAVLESLLQELKRNQAQEYLIVAVRPGGIQSFQKLRSLVEARGIDLGYEPLGDEWQLKFEASPSAPAL